MSPIPRWLLAAASSRDFAAPGNPKSPLFHRLASWAFPSRPRSRRAVPYGWRPTEARGPRSVRRSFESGPRGSSRTRLPPPRPRGRRPPSRAGGSAPGPPARWRESGAARPPRDLGRAASLRPAYGTGVRLPLSLPFRTRAPRGTRFSYPPRRSARGERSTDTTVIGTGRQRPSVALVAGFLLCPAAILSVAPPPLPGIVRSYPLSPSLLRAGNGSPDSVVSYPPDCPVRRSVDTIDRSLAARGSRRSPPGRVRYQSVGRDVPCPRGVSGPPISYPTDRGSPRLRSPQIAPPAKPPPAAPSEHSPAAVAPTTVSVPTIAESTSPALTFPCDLASPPAFGTSLLGCPAVTSDLDFQRD
ncbi:serine/arginine repetitive matrix protein 1-like [Ornithorhynchus anatinus]|uniref:serine/arginine repetitive matrix protein 1-like n=1 Tax=Ornithorhynchus anatinus TaxID=9258 RepID=UPI0010A7AD49|nr:serine/arginine repetitive matrix protein 1-like [Ornithorhynchus anatinus]